MKTVFLCGFMGCGKSTCGRLCAEMTGRSFCDMDEYIVSHEGKSIPEIFAAYGESGFRERETDAVRGLSSFGGIVACGGGAMVSAVNASIAKEKGIVIFIDTPFEICLGRISNDSNRPIASSKSESEMLELYNTRRKAYLSAADFVIDGSKTADETAQGIASAVRRYASQDEK